MSRSMPRRMSPSLKERNPVDNHFLEFWGNCMNRAVKSQKQLEEMANRMSQGFRGLECLTDLFRKVYGLDQLSQQSLDYSKIWSKAQDDFWKSLRDYLRSFGVVPEEDHLALVKKYQELKEEAAAREETVQQLRSLLSRKTVGEGETSGGLQVAPKDKASQLQELGNSPGKAGKGTKDNKMTSKKSPPSSKAITSKVD
jgi:hypothetical protein